MHRFGKGACFATVFKVVWLSLKWTFVHNVLVIQTNIYSQAEACEMNRTIN